MVLLNLLGLTVESVVLQSVTRKGHEDNAENK
jgi:hypothetical protein